MKTYVTRMLGTLHENLCDKNDGYFT
jgi:hypothetical protein